MSDMMRFLRMALSYIKSQRSLLSKIYCSGTVKWVSLPTHTKHRYNTSQLDAEARVSKSLLWRIRPLLRSDTVNNSRCYGAPAAYACAVTSHNSRRGDAGDVFCWSDPRLYDSTDRVLLSEWVQRSWGFNCGVLNRGQRKRNNLYC
jgi:hypothetical protein